MPPQRNAFRRPVYVNNPDRSPFGFFRDCQPLFPVLHCTGRSYWSFRTVCGAALLTSSCALRRAGYDPSGRGSDFSARAWAA